jgi:uncharacterized protein (DUF1697 family)
MTPLGREICMRSTTIPPVGAPGTPRHGCPRSGPGGACRGGGYPVPASVPASVWALPSGDRTGQYGDVPDEMSGRGTADGPSPQVLLLRGVNLGPHRRIAMADLRELLAGMGLGEVRTVLQSGNAVLTVAPDEPAVTAQRIQRELADRLGLVTDCLVLTAADLLAVVSADPFAAVADNGSRYQVFFLFDRPAARVRAEHDPRSLDPDRIRVGDQVIYQWCPDGILAAPPVGPFLVKRWKITATARNWNTVTKLAALVRS